MGKHIKVYVEKTVIPLDNILNYTSCSFIHIVKLFPGAQSQMPWFWYPSLVLNGTEDVSWCAVMLQIIKNHKTHWPIGLRAEWNTIENADIIWATGGSQLVTQLPQWNTKPLTMLQSGTWEWEWGSLNKYTLDSVSLNMQSVQFVYHLTYERGNRWVRNYTKRDFAQWKSRAKCPLKERFSRLKSHTTEASGTESTPNNTKDDMQYINPQQCPVGWSRRDKRMVGPCESHGQMQPHHVHLMHTNGHRKQNKQSHKIHYVFKMHPM